MLFRQKQWKHTATKQKVQIKLSQYYGRNENEKKKEKSTRKTEQKQQKWEKRLNETKIDTRVKKINHSVLFEAYFPCRRNELRTLLFLDSFGWFGRINRGDDGSTCYTGLDKLIYMCFFLGIYYIDLDVYTYKFYLVFLSPFSYLERKKSTENSGIFFFELFKMVIHWMLIIFLPTHIHITCLLYVYSKLVATNGHAKFCTHSIPTRNLP